jgi:hypothetical protein
MAASLATSSSTSWVLSPYVDRSDSFFLCDTEPVELIESERACSATYIQRYFMLRTSKDDDLELKPLVVSALMQGCSWIEEVSTGPATLRLVVKPHATAEERTDLLATVLSILRGIDIDASESDIQIDFESAHLHDEYQDDVSRHHLNE